MPRRTVDPSEIAGPAPEGIISSGSSSRAIDPSEIIGPADQPKLPNSVFGGAWREAKAIPTGIASLFRKSETPEETAIETTSPLGILGVAMYRMGKGEVESRKTLWQQGGQSFERAKEFGEQSPLYRDIEATRGTLSRIGSVLPIPGIAESLSNVNQLKEEGRGKEAAGQGGVDALTYLLTGTKPGRQAVRTAAETALKTTGLPKYFPRTAEVSGNKIPVLAGEAEPGSVMEKKLETIKRRGYGEEKIKGFQNKQQQASQTAVRNIIRKGAGQPSPLAEQTPRGQAWEAADRIKIQAQVLYKSIDSELLKSPKDMSKVGYIVSKAYAKAKAYGANLEDLPEPPKPTGLVDQYGKPIMTSPAQAVQPLEGIQTIRSELLRISRTSSDPIIVNDALKEAHGLSAEIEDTLRKSSNPIIYRSWVKANDLWTQQHALRTVSEGITNAVEGTAPSMQAPGLGTSPLKLKGKALVNDLRKLDSHRRGKPVAEGNGDLTAALGKEQAKAFKQVADILDRAQRSNIGREGEVIGHGGSPKYVFERVVWTLAKRFGAGRFVNAMTGRGFAYNLNRLLEEKNPSTARIIANRLQNALIQSGMNKGAQKEGDNQ